MSALILALLEKHHNGNQVRDCLVHCGHEVFVVDTFTKAMALLKTQKIDLIISDVHLENGGSVFDFLRLIKKSQWTCDIPFVLFSFQPTPIAKYLADGTRTTMRYLGADKYIEMETFDAAEFREHINSLIPHLLPAIKDSELEKKIGE
jgi:CheY-like chemotaxis protein